MFNSSLKTNEHSEKTLKKNVCKEKSSNISNNTQQSTQSAIKERSKQNTNSGLALLPECRFSKNKYTTLIDQSDLRWYADLQTGRLPGGIENVVSISNPEPPETSIESESELNILSYAPFQCPILNCDSLVLANDMTMHYLSYHKDPAPAQRLFENQRLLLTMKPYNLTPEEIVCLGLISYGGNNPGGKAGDRLARCDMCVTQNLLLHKDYKHFKCDYPIFILASVVPITKLQKSNTTEANNNTGKILFVWLAGTDFELPIFCTITAFKDDKCHSRSGISTVRTLSLSQKPWEFFPEDTEHFRLHFNEIAELTLEDKSLMMQLVIVEGFSIN